MTVPRPRSYPGERGIGGLLLLFVFMQLLVVVVLLFQLRGFVGGVRSSWPLGETMAFMRPALAVESLMYAVRVVGIPVGLLLLFRHSPGTPVYWKILLGMTIVWAAVDVILILRLYAGVHSQLTAIGASTQAVAAQRSAGVGNDIRLGLHAAAWLVYWSTSERVRLTFGRPATPAAR